MTKPALDQPSARFRSAPARGVAPRVGGDRIDQNAGRYSAGIIRGFSVIARGEALGHGLWIDDAMVEATTAAVNELNEGDGVGPKSRFAHADASGDAIGSTLGRCDNARTVGGKCFADLHMLGSAHESPDGDLAGYVLKLAAEDPESFGASISFQRDEQSELMFAIENGAEIDEDRLDFTNFQSPDELNVHNLPHARLGVLYSADIVDDPAANPDGLFHAGKRSVPKDADELLSYALGRTTQRPTSAAFDIDPDRVSGFVSRYLETHGLEITNKEPETMSKETTPETPTAEQLATEKATAKSEAKAELLAEQKKYTARFGAEAGLEHFNAGTGYLEALELHAKGLEDQLSAQTAKVGELNEALAASKTGEDNAIDLGADEDDAPQATGLGAVMGSNRKSASN
jgi:hypothetical protein